MKPPLERNVQLGFAVALATVIAAGAATPWSSAAPAGAGPLPLEGKV